MAVASIEASLRELLDREQIRDLARLYAHHVWRKEVSAAIELFTEDGEMDSAAKNLNAVVLTSATTELWVALGLYVFGCVCGVAAIGSPTPESEKAMAIFVASMELHP